MPETRDENLDELLAALQDGELGPEEARALRRRIEGDPALQRRRAAFMRVDESLRGLESREVPADLAARLRARIEAGDDAPTRVAGPGRTRTVPPRRIGRTLAGWGVAAAAAGLVLYVSLQPSAPPGVVPADLAQGDLVGEAATRGAVQAPPEVPSQIALVPEPAETLAQPAPIPAPASDLFATASEDEIAIAFHYETLSDLEMIQDMEMLELLATLDDMEPRG